MKTDEMVEILSRIARDEDKNPTARCTAIRTFAGPAAAALIS